MSEVFFFRKLYTPTFIQFIFWLWLAAIWAGALVGGIAIMSQGGIMILLGLIYIPVVGILGTILARIGCEILIVIFQIHSELIAIRTGTAPGAPGFPVTPIPTPAPQA